MNTKARARISSSRSRFQYHPERPRSKIGQSAPEIQAFGTIAKLPNGLSEKICQTSVERLNQVLADTMTLRDLYKKHHWQGRLGQLLCMEPQNFSFGTGCR